MVKHVISECVNSALATVASHTHFLVGAWLKAQGAALMLSTFASLDLIFIRAMSSPSQSPPDAAHLPQHPAPPHLLRGPHGSTSGNTVDRFTILPSRVHSQVTSPTPPWRLSARRTLLRRQVSVPHIIPLRKSRRSPCSRVRFTILAMDDWLHRCLSTREKQVSFSPEFITLKEKTPRHTCRTEAR